MMFDCRLLLPYLYFGPLVLVPLVTKSLFTMLLWLNWKKSIYFHQDELTQDGNGSCETIIPWSYMPNVTMWEKYFSEILILLKKRISLAFKHTCHWFHKSIPTCVSLFFCPFYLSSYIYLVIKWSHWKLWINLDGTYIW